MNSIHGHEVLRMMLDSGKSYSKAGLVQDIVTRFGKEARFHTCSAEELTAEQLVAFLESRGKFVERGGGLQTDRSLMCDKE